MSQIFDFLRVLTNGFGNWSPVNDVEGALPDCLCSGLLWDPGSKRFGGCVRVGREWILTAHHNIDIPDLANRFRVRFGYLGDDLAAVKEYALDPYNGGFFCSDDGVQGPSGYGFDLDYAFIRLRDAQERDPQLQLAKRPARMPREAEPVRVPHHIEGGPMVLPIEWGIFDSRLGTVIEMQPDYVVHKGSTKPGASGSPMLDQSWALVGIHTHHAWRDHEDPAKQASGWGTRIDRIVADARQRGFTHLGEMEALQGL